MSTDRLHLPQPEPFPGDTADIPFFLISDDAFALEEFLMKPYGHRNLTHEERIFNNRVLTTTMRHRSGASFMKLPLFFPSLSKRRGIFNLWQGFP